MVRARASTTNLVDHYFYKVLKPVLDQLKLNDRPSQIYNADESFVCLSGGPSTVLAKRGCKAPQRIIGGSGRENITVHCCFSASGQYVPPYIVYAGKKLMFAHTQGGPIGARYGVSPSGWMTQKTFIDWFKSSFVPSLPHERPVILILDGHDSHVTYELRVLAMENDVHLVKLPSHLTHFLDVAFFKPMKNEWNKVVEDYTRRELRQITKAQFPPLLSRAWKNVCKPQYAVSGFLQTGIFPFNPQAIPSQVLAPNERFKGMSSVDLNEKESDDEDDEAKDENNENDENDEQDIESHNEDEINSVTTLSSVVSALEADGVTETTENNALHSVSIITEQSTSTTEFVTTTSTPTTQTASTASSSSNSSPEYLQEYFLQFFQSQTPKRVNKQPRKRLTGFGESLTGEEALERLRKDEEEKKEKERQKEERKRIREEKKKEREEKKKEIEERKRKRQEQRMTKTTPKIKRRKTKNSEKAGCLECGLLSDDDDDENENWIQCESCLGWIHQTCGGHPTLNSDQLQALTFLCKTCEDEEIVT